MTQTIENTDLLEELRWRGLLYQQTEGLAEALARGPVTGYCGFDPTAVSLHVGNLVPVMGLVHLQRAGHRPVGLVGGGTGMIGDPSGRASERALLTPEQVAANTAALRRQLERFLDFSGSRGALLLDNADWLAPMDLLGFLRDVGKHFTVNYMLAKESVKSRIEAGISFTEFAYQLLQAYDFLELHRREGVTLQVGGSDQWGNMTAGMELIRRTVGGEAHVCTFPLLTTASGEKFGKSAGNAVWLDPELTSPYQFYQFWITVDDRDVGKLLRFFTLLPREEIEALDRAHSERPERREAQSALARDVTARVHGEEATRVAVDASRVVFDRKLDPREIGAPVLDALFRDLPSATVAVGETGTVSAIDLLTATGLAASRGEARRVLQQGGVQVNGERVAPEHPGFGPAEALHGRYFLVRKGKQEIALARVGEG